MKKSLCMILVVGVLVSAGAREKKPKLTAQGPETKLEAFEKQTGTVIIRGRSEIGSVSAMGTVSVDCIDILDVSTGQRQMGIIIEVKAPGKYERTDRAFVDYDEIQSLLNGIDYIAKVTQSSTKLSSFEAAYKTTGELSVVTYSSSKGKIEAAVSAGYTSSARAFISTEKLKELRSVIAQAKKKLDEIR